jgi:hypothetical protein
MDTVMPAAGQAAFTVDRRIEIVLGDDPPTVPPELEPGIAAAWSVAQRRAGGQLFNGRVFSVESAEPDRVVGHLVDYRLAVAAFGDPLIRAALNIRPLSVAGVLRTPDGLLFGRRCEAATHEAGFWQMPPAGSLGAGAVRGGTVQPERQLRRGVEDELGLSWSAISRCRPFGMVVHARTGAHDLGMVLDTELGFDEIEAAWRAGGSAAYTALRVVEEDALDAFIAREARGLVPAAPHLLRLLRGRR